MGSSAYICILLCLTLVPVIYFSYDIQYLLIYDVSCATSSWCPSAASCKRLFPVPRLRSGSVCTMGDVSGGIGKRPHSVISVSSSSASSSASSASSSHSSTVCPTYVGALNLGFEPGDSPRALHRSVTRTSQCSAGMWC